MRRWDLWGVFPEVWGLDGTGEGGVREERRMCAVMG